MNISESYKKRLQELAGIDGVNLDNFSKEEYSAQLSKLGVENFEDLVGRVIYNIKPVYGEHKVLKWFPDRGEYLLFTAGQRILASPFTIIPIPDKTEKEMDSELKWVIEKLCEDDTVISVDIKNKGIDDNGTLSIVFDIITEDSNGYGRTATAKYEGVKLKLWIDKENGLIKTYEGFDKEIVLKTNFPYNAEGTWNKHAPFIGPNYRTTRDDWNYMKKIIERIILDMI